MKKTPLIIALAVAMVLPMTSMAATNAVQYMVGQDNVRVSNRDWTGGIRFDCVLKRETKVNVIRRYESFSTLLIEVTDGPHRGCRGFVRDSYLVGVPIHTQRVFTSGRWGSEVPVFRNREIYYSARASMDEHGQYKDQLGSVACMLSVGTTVDFKPFRNWGVGEVETGNCSGWIDREVIK